MRRQVRFRRHPHDVPTLNVASLPDLIFTVLFFFMIVTHMRKDEPQVSYQVPQGTELRQLTHKHAVSYIYIGRPLDASGDTMCIQLNGRLASLDEISRFVSDQRSRLSEDDLPFMTVSIKADRQAPMGLVGDVKAALRRAGALTIHYSASEAADASRQ